MDDDRAIELYGKSRQVRKGLDGHSQFARFVSLPKPAPLMDDREAFLVTANQDLQDLANFVNEFTINVNVLRAWNALLPSLDEDELLFATWEFINPPGYFCLGVPYALKGRLLSSIARVSHLANEFCLPGWAHVPRLGQSSLEKATEHACNWSGWARLRACLGRLDNRPFRKASASFRNEFHHGSPRMIVLGEKPFVDRREGGLTIVGAVPPLKLEDVVAALMPQQRAAVAAYDAFLELVLEQVAIVTANKPIEPTI